MANENLRRRRTTIHDISDDTLEVILQRIPSPVVLVRAAATCKLWRRVIGDAGFLRRFRRLNRPRVLGHHVYRSTSGGSTVFIPFPAPEAEEIAISGSISERVSLSFLPTSSCWVPHDSRDGLLVASSFGFLICVCCPWTQQHKLFFCPMRPACEAEGYPCPTEILGVFLLDADPDDTPTGLNLSNFRILCVEVRHCRPKGSQTVQASVFSERDMRWLQLGTMSVGNIARGMLPFEFELVGRSGGSICWSTKFHNAILHLDESSGEFSSFTLPGHAVGTKRYQVYYDRSSIQVIGGNTSSLRLLHIVGDDLEVLCYDRGLRACVVERRVRPSQVPSNDYGAREYCRRWYFAEDTFEDEEPAPGRIVLCDNKCGVEYVWMFSVHTQDIELQRVQKLLNRHGCRAFLCELPWTISVCL